MLYLFNLINGSTHGSTDLTFILVNGSTHGSTNAIFILTNGSAPYTVSIFMSTMIC